MILRGKIEACWNNLSSHRDNSIVCQFTFKLKFRFQESCLIQNDKRRHALDKLESMTLVPHRRRTSLIFCLSLTWIVLKRTNSFFGVLWIFYVLFPQFLWFLKACLKNVGCSQSLFQSRLWLFYESVLVKAYAYASRIQIPILTLLKKSLLLYLMSQSFVGSQRSSESLEVTAFITMSEKVCC